MAKKVITPPTLEAHPLSKLFPPLEDDDLAELAESTRQHGLQVPITLHENKILEGNNRYRACSIAGVEPRFEELPAGADPLTFVITRNLHRRHLTTSQRAVVAAKISNLPQGRRPAKLADDKHANLQVCRPDAAKLLSVSERSVATARQVLAGPPKLAEHVEAGRLTLNSANKLLKLHRPVLEDMLAEASVEELDEYCEKEIARDRRQGERERAREEREKQAAARPAKQPVFDLLRFGRAVEAELIGLQGALDHGQIRPKLRPDVIEELEYLQQTMGDLIAALKEDTQTLKLH